MLLTSKIVEQDTCTSNLPCHFQFESILIERYSYTLKKCLVHRYSKFSDLVKFSQVPSKILLKFKVTINSVLTN